MQAVFLDRDGVINENRPDHVKSWREFRFLPGVRGALARLARADLQVFIVSNQAAINRGLLTREAVDAINMRMKEEIERAGGRVDAIACCPHRPEEGCYCRKPQPGLLLSLAKVYGVELRRAAVIGDALTDIEAGLAAGCNAILVRTGRGNEQAAIAASARKSGFSLANDLSGAVDLLLAGLPTIETPEEANPCGCW